tara:strand:+ start:184 stop:414 length:231 start_codon:yes stop_codon:yes gene_type:complete
MSIKITEELLIKNALLAFIHNYPTHTWTQECKDLLGRIDNGQYPTTKTQGRRRPAKRQRKKETTSNTTIKEEIKTT